MGVFVPVLNAAQVEMQFSQHDGSFAENEFWVQRSEAWDNASLLALCASFHGWYDTGDGTSSYVKLQNSTTALQAIAARDNTTQTSPSVVYNSSLPDAGLSGDTGYVPLGTSICITSRTGLAGRSFRGRTYLVDLDASIWSSVPNNTVSAAKMTDIINAFNALIAKISGDDPMNALVVCSRYHQVVAGTPPTVARAEGITTPVTAFGYHDLFTDFQRRRAPAHNRHH